MPTGGIPVSLGRGGCQIKSIEGHEGLYEVSDVIYFDAQEENNEIENPIKEKVKK